MGRILYNTKKQDEFFQIIGDPPKFTSGVFIKLFAYTKKDGIQFYTDDLIKIGSNNYPGIKDNIITTIGIYMANKFLYEDLHLFGYVNKTIDADVNAKIDKILAKALKAEDVTQETVCTYIDKCQFLFGGPLAHIINTSMSETLLSLPSSAKALKNKLFKENKEALDNNDPIVSAKIASQVVDESLKEMKTKHDPAVGLFDSNCGIDPYNNYRTMFVMKGAVADNTGLYPSGFKVVKSNYDNGITKEDLPLIADSLVTSAYTKGVATQDSGTSAKQVNAVFQRIRLQARNSDCKTDRTLPVTITADIKSNYIYRYIVENKRLVMLTDDNIDNYVNKTVNMRSPIYCHAEDPEYCNICTGDRLYRVGIKNIGLTFNIMRGATMNLQMKSFHDTTVKYTTISDKEFTQFMN